MLSLVPDKYKKQLRGIPRYGWQFCQMVLIALFFVQAIGFALENGPTFDEPLDYGVGVEYLFTGKLALANDHPPLSRLLSAASQFAWSYVSGQTFVRSIENAVPLAARMPGIVLGAFVLFALGEWVQRLGGSLPSLLAMFLGATDPTFVAHASLVTPDISITCFIFLCAYFVWEYTQHPSWIHYLLAGTMAGLSLLSKFSALPLLFSILCVALVTCRGRLPFPRASVRPSWLVSMGLIIGWMSIAGLSLCYVYGSDIGFFLMGVWTQFLHTKTGHSAFFLGLTGTMGWPEYFTVAYMIKTPLATLGCLALGIASLRYKHTKTAWFYFALMPLLCLVILLLSHINIGVRYLLPAYPFFWGLAALGIITVQQCWPRAVQYLVGLLVTVQCVSVGMVFPHYLAYANEMYGGPEQLPAYLSDSNVDWGQDVHRIPAFMQEQGVQDIRLAIFSTVPPTRFGMRAQRVPTCWHVPDRYVPATDPKQLFAVSVMVLSGTCPGDLDYSWLRERQPIAVLGYSIYIYDITNDADAHRQLARRYTKDNQFDLARHETIKAEEIEARGL